MTYSHESYRFYDENSDSLITTLHDNRKYVYFHIDYLDEFIIEVKSKSTKEVMLVNFQKRSYDITYNILVNFKKGNYNIHLTNLWNYFTLNYKKRKMKFQTSKITKVKSNFFQDKYNDWIKILNISAFEI